MSLYGDMRRLLERRRRRLGWAEAAAVEASAAIVAASGGASPGPPAPPGGPITAAAIQAGGPVSLDGAGRAGPRTGRGGGLGFGLGFRVASAAQVDAIAAAALYGVDAGPVPGLSSSRGVVIRATPSDLLDADFEDDTLGGLTAGAGTPIIGGGILRISSPRYVYLNDPTVSGRTIEATLGGVTVDSFRLFARSSLVSGSFTGNIVYLDFNSTQAKVSLAIASNILVTDTQSATLSPGDVVALSVKGTTARATINGVQVAAITSAAVDGSGYWGVRAMSNNRDFDRIRIY